MQSPTSGKRALFDLPVADAPPTPRPTPSQANHPSPTVDLSLTHSSPASATPAGRTPFPPQWLIYITVRNLAKSLRRPGRHPCAAHQIHGWRAHGGRARSVRCGRRFILTGEVQSTGHRQKDVAARPLHLPARDPHPAPPATHSPPGHGAPAPTNPRPRAPAP